MHSKQRKRGSTPDQSNSKTYPVFRLALLPSQWPLMPLFLLRSTSKINYVRMMQSLIMIINILWTPIESLLHTTQDLICIISLNANNKLICTWKTEAQKLKDLSKVTQLQVATPEIPSLSMHHTLHLCTIGSHSKTSIQHPPVP